MLHFNSCMKCGEQTGNGNYCQECAPAQEEKEMDITPSTPIDAEEVAREYRDYQLRQLHRDAALAALTIAARPTSEQQGPVYPKDAVGYAIDVADEFVRQYNPDAVIAEVVG